MIYRVYRIYESDEAGAVDQRACRVIFIYHTFIAFGRSVAVYLKRKLVVQSSVNGVVTAQGRRKQISRAKEQASHLPAL